MVPQYSRCANPVRGDVGISSGPRILVVSFLAIHATPAAPSHLQYRPVAAPEYDLRLAIEGLAVAGAAGALIWERMRRRR